MEKIEEIVKFGDKIAIFYDGLQMPNYIQTDWLVTNSYFSLWIAMLGGYGYKWEIIIGSSTAMRRK